VRLRRSVASAATRYVRSPGAMPTWWFLTAFALSLIAKRSGHAARAFVAVAFLAAWPVETAAARARKREPPPSPRHAARKGCVPVWCAKSCRCWPSPSPGLFLTQAAQSGRACASWRASPQRPPRQCADRLRDLRGNMFRRFESPGGVTLSWNLAPVAKWRRARHGWIAISCSAPAS